MKKAEVSTWWVGALVGFVIIFILFVSFRDQIWHRPIDIIPGYNDTIPNKEILGKLRYNITGDRVQYFDSKNWISFEDWVTSVPVANKKITQGQARFYFANYFYDDSKRGQKKVELGIEHATNNLKTPIANYYKYFNIEAFGIATKGKVYFSGVYGGTPMQFFLAPNNVLYSTELDNSKAVAGRIQNIASQNPTIQISIPQSSSVKSELKEHLLNLDGLLFPDQATILQDNPSVYLRNDITLSEKYKISYLSKRSDFSPAEQIYSIYTLQVYYVNAPLPIYVEIFHRTDDTLSADVTVETLSEKNAAPFTPISDAETEIIRLVSEWRDSVLSTPICICYENDTQCGQFEVERKTNGEDAFLVTDLAKRIGDC